MPVKIIQENERLLYEVGGSKFYYKRIGITAQAEILRQSQDKPGEVNFLEMAKLTLEHCLVDWEDVQNGVENVPFKKELIECLPLDIATGIYAEIMKRSPDNKEQVETELKNFESTSN